MRGKLTISNFSSQANKGWLFMRGKLFMSLGLDKCSYFAEEKKITKGIVLKVFTFM